MIGLGLIDVLVRGFAVGGFAILGIALAVAPQPASSRWVGAAFFATTIGHTMNNCLALQLYAGPLGSLMWALSAMGSGMFWTFAVTLFRDHSRLPWQWLIPPPASLGLAMIARTLDHGQDRSAWIVYDLFVFGLVCHALLIIWRGGRDDLVEPRRALRAPVMAAAAAYVLITAANDLGGVFGHPIPNLGVFQGFALAGLAAMGSVALLRLDPVLIGGGEKGSPRIQPPQGLDGSEAALFARLTRAMMEEEVWRREDLSIRSLADHVAAPEHRLRRLINGALGYRNFAAFINTRRIEAARVALVDPVQARKPVSAIAYDLGFGSLGPFNRAFRDATGMTPTAWRQAQDLAEIRNS